MRGGDGAGGRDALSAVPARARAPLPGWVTVDSAGRTMTSRSRCSGRAGGSATIAGYDRGKVEVVVPVNWTVKWTG
ncbi:MAG: hypothetical protein U0133_06170 [Gemmatimonadales bacterium]